MKSIPAIAAALCLGSGVQASTFVAFLDGPSESPPNASPATGNAIVTYDGVLHTLRVQISFSGLLGTTTQAHIHAPTTDPLTGTIGVAVTPGTLPGFPVGVTDLASYDETIDLTLDASYTAGFRGVLTAAQAEAKLLAAIMDGKAYVNVHTTSFPGGEIRGFLVVPEPGTYALVAGLGLCGFGVWRRLSRVGRDAASSL